MYTHMCICIVLRGILSRVCLLLTYSYIVMSIRAVSDLSFPAKFLGIYNNLTKKISVHSWAPSSQS